MILDRLQRVTYTSPITIIKNERSTAVGCDARRDCRKDRRGCSAILDQIAVFCVFDTVGEGGLWLGRSETEGEGAVLHADLPFAPAGVVAHELTDGKGVKELVCDEVSGLFWQRVYTVDPVGRVGI